MRVAIIIVSRRWDAHYDQCIGACSKQGFIFTYVDDSKSPGQMRDECCKGTGADAFAFIDADAYPDPNWIRNAVLSFELDPSLDAVCGPGITPPDDPYWAQVSGATYEHPLVSGPELWRYVPCLPRIVRDAPTCNLIVRREAHERVGGFGTLEWPGEDTLYTEKLGKILYDPGVIVYHHRRDSLRGHLRQVWGYATQRGKFFRKYGGSSRRWIYLAPSALVLTFPVAGVPYLLAVLATTWKRPAVAMCVALTHFTYGIGFLRGLTK